VSSPFWVRTRWLRPAFVSKLSQDLVRGHPILGLTKRLLKATYRRFCATGLNRSSRCQNNHRLLRGNVARIVEERIFSEASQQTRIPPKRSIRALNFWRPRSVYFGIDHTGSGERPYFIGFQALSSLIFHGTSGRCLDLASSLSIALSARVI